MIAVDAFVSFAERRIVREADELDDDVLLLAQVHETLPQSFDEIFVDIDRFRIVVERCDEISDPRAP